MDIIKEFYSGKLFPQELSPPLGKEYILACEKVCDLEKKLREEVGEEEYKKYEDLQKALAPVDFENQAQAFKVGFSIGSLFMYENLSIFSKLGKK